jgi:hypothetical protein
MVNTDRIRKRDARETTEYRIVIYDYYHTIRDEVLEVKASILSFTDAGSSIQTAAFGIGIVLKCYTITTISLPFLFHHFSFMPVMA